MKNFNFFEKLWEHSRTLRRVGLVLVMCLMAIPQVWGYGSSAGTVVYFDMQDCSGFGTPYFRVGRTTALSRSYQLSLVGGTKYLYSYPLGQWDNYDAFSVANGKGWTGDDGNSTIYQPHSGQYENGNNKTGYDGDKIITKQTTFMSENISGNYYIKIGSATGSLSYNCQYYDRTNGSLPTYSISYDAPSNGTLTVQQYTGSSYTALASGTTGLKPTQIIKVTTSPSTHYGLASLTVTGATQIDGGDTYYITGNCTVTATFAPKWTIKGGNSNDTDDSDAMGNWATYNNLTYTGTANTYSGTITLAANTTYRFKVVDRDNGTPVYWGYGGSDAYHLTFLGQSGASQALGTNSDNKENLALMSAGAGTYTFTWNSSSKTLTVDFPTVTHPSTDYIYYKDYDNYDSHGDIVAHVWGGSTASTGDQRMPVVNSFNFDGTTYFYAALGNNTKAIFAGSDNTATYKTEDLNSASTKKGKFYDKSSNSSESTRWQPFTATLTLDHQGASSPNPSSVTVTYGATTNINTDVISSKGSKSGYTWGGFYTEQGGEGIQIINTSEKIPSNLDGYTSSGKWIKTGSSVSATIYAKWTQTPKLGKNGGSADGSATVAFNGTSMKDITAPTFDGYTVDGYYKESSCTHLIMSANGALEKSTDYTDASGKWTRSASAPTLYAHWKINPPTITNECNRITISTTAAGTTIYYTLDGSNPTTMSSVYDPSNKPTIAANSTVKAFATKSGCSNSDVATEVCTFVTTYSVNYNANLDGTSGSTASQTGHCQDDVVATSACGFSKDNYKFKWWNKSSAGTGEDFYPGEEVTFTSSANIPLYAQWEPVASGWAYWVGDVAISSAGTAYDVTGNGVTMQITRESSADWNDDITQSYNQVSKYNSTTAKKAKVLAVDADNSYIEVNFNEGSTINDLYLGITSDQTSAQNFVVCYSTTADFSKGEYEFVKVGSTNNVVSVPGHDQATKSETRVKPSTADKYKYVRIYRKLTNGTGYNSTGGDLGCSNKARIYSIKAQAGSSCSAPTAPTISGTADYIVGQTLTLTADISGSNHDASTTYTWYKGANWATASESSPVQAAAVAGSNGHIFTKTAAVGDAGTYWCEASNGTGCESHNSTGKAVTVAYQVTYAANGGTGDAMANSTGTSITLSANSYTAPSGYTFDGWRTVSDKQASGTDYAAGTSSITANLDLYAMWKQTVTLDDNGGTKDGSAVVYYNASSASTPSAPTYSGYTADGYYAEPGCTNLVMSTAGALTNYSGYVSGGKWVHSGATTLYAHYKCTAPTISCTDNVVTMSTTSTGATIYYTTDGSTTPTSSSTAYDPSNKPVIAANTTIKAIAIQSGCTSSSVTTQSCTYTAFSTSINLEQGVLDNSKSWDYASALTTANITKNGSGFSLDSLDDSKDKVRNKAYLGLKIKNSGSYVEIKLPADNELNVKFGYVADSVRIDIDGVRKYKSIAPNINLSETREYTLASAGSNRTVRFTTTGGGTVVLKQIMIGEDLKTVTLPGRIIILPSVNGSVTATNTVVNVDSEVTLTVTPDDGFELATIAVNDSVKGVTGGTLRSSTNVFTMPDGNVKVTATFVASCTDPGLAFAEDSKTTTLCDAAPTNALTNTHSVAVTYTSSDPTVATVASDGTLTIKAAGTTTITASSIAQTVSAVDYCADEASYTLTVSASTAAGLAYGTSTVKKDVGDDAFTNTLTNSNGLEVTYESSNTSVATVDEDGEVTIKGAGTTTITASAAKQKIESTCYAAGSATYTLTVYPVYTVTYNAMGGTCSPTSTNTTTALGKVTLPSATHASYTTYSWVTSDGTEAGDAGDTYTPEGNINLYAKWSGSCAGGGGSGSTIFKARVKTSGMTSNKSAIEALSTNTVLTTDNYLSELVGGTFTLALTAAKASVPNDSTISLTDNGKAYLIGALSGTTKFQAGDIITVGVYNQAGYIQKTSGSYSALTDISVAKGTTRTSFVVPTSLIGENTFYIKGGSNGMYFAYVEVYRPGSVLFFAEVDEIASAADLGTSETEQTTSTYLASISGGKLYTKGSAATYAQVVTTHEISLSQANNNTYIKLTLDKKLAEGDKIIINTSTPSKPFFITTAAARATTIAAPYTIPAESEMINQQTIYLWRNSSTSNLRSIAIVRHSGGTGTCYTVTYDGNGATSGYVNDPRQYTSGAFVSVSPNIGGFARERYTFNGWNTAADGSGTDYDFYSYPNDHFNIIEDVTLYAQWKIRLTEDNTNLAGYDEEELEQNDVEVANGATLTITKDLTVRNLTVETGSTLNINTTNGDGTGDGVTLATKSLSLKGGWDESKTKYDMPRVYIDKKSSLTKEEDVVNFDISVNHRNYYPIALPFDVPLNSVDYARSDLASISEYGVHYEIDEYNGQSRANYGSGTGNWTRMEPGSTLKAGKGYILSAITDGGKAIIRFPMTFTNDWTAEGEQGTVDSVVKNVISVTAYVKDEGETPIANKGWNLLGVPFMSCYTTGDGMYTGDGMASLIQGRFDYSTGKWTEEDVNVYVTIPTHDFTEYIQSPVGETVLLPGWCFFVQVDETGNLAFLTAKEAQGTDFPYEVPRRANVSMPTVKTGIILSGNETSDKTTIIVSDKYNAAEYEINADLEKMFGENGYTLATYTLSGETRLAYNAMNNADIMNVIPVGYRAPEEGEYTFSINPRYAENEAFEQVNLIDYEEGVITNLLQSSYSFTTARTQNDARFAINVVKRQDMPTDVENVQGGDAQNSKVRKVLINDKLYIILDGKMYDATGKMLK